MNTGNQCKPAISSLLCLNTLSMQATPSTELESVKIIGQEDHRAFMQDTWGHKHSHSATGNKSVIRATTFPYLWNNFAASFVKTRLRITANIITGKGMWMGSESCAKFSTNCWCWKIWWWWWWNFIKVSKEAP